MQPWHRWREPLAVVLLVALALMLAVQIATVVLSWRARDTSALLGVPADELLLLATVAAVLWCTTPVALGDGADAAPSRHAWPIAVAGLLVVGATGLVWLALALWNGVLLLRTPWPAPDFALFAVQGLLQLVVPGAAIVAVGLAMRRARAAGRSGSSQPPPGPPQPALTTPEVPPERLPAAWHADEAAGAVWLTADDAAQGRPGLSWSDPAEEWAPGPSIPKPPTEKPAAEDDDLR